MIFGGGEEIEIVSYRVFWRSCGVGEVVEVKKVELLFMCIYEYM